MNEQWTLAEGIQHLFAEGDEATEDLSTDKHPFQLDVSFCEIETTEINGVKVPPTKGISVILTSDNMRDPEGDLLMFSNAFFPDDGETLPELALRLAQEMGIDPKASIWYDADL